MPSILFRVTGYTYTIHTPGNPNYLVFDGDMLVVRGVISCAGEGHRAYVVALSDNSPFPKNKYQPSGKSAWIFCRTDQFPWHLDMLRNEGPVYCSAYVDENGKSSCVLTTDSEPVGEGEGP